MFKFRLPGVTSFSSNTNGDSEPIDPDFNEKYHLTEGYLDGPYDFAYSRIDAYMDTSGSVSSTETKYGIKAQMFSFFVAPGTICLHAIQIMNFGIIYPEYQLYNRLNFNLTFQDYAREALCISYHEAMTNSVF